MPGPKHENLNVFVGRWHTTGDVSAPESLASLSINFLDTYKWYPGGFFLVHEAEGTIGGEQE